MLAVDDMFAHVCPILRRACAVVLATVPFALVLVACENKLDEPSCRKLSVQAFAIANSGNENLCLKDADCVVADWPDACGKVVSQKAVDKIDPIRKQFTDGKCETKAPIKQCGTHAVWCKEGICTDRATAEVPKSTGE